VGARGEFENFFAEIQEMGSSGATTPEGMIEQGRASGRGRRGAVEGVVERD